MVRRGWDTLPGNFFTRKPPKPRQMSKKSKSLASKPAASGSAASLLGVWTKDSLVEPTFVQGHYRSYVSTDLPATLTKTRSFSRSELPLIAVLILAGFYIRLRNLDFPNSVVFDEVHFGGFSKKYVLGNFFMDVHPPLAKMLFAGVSALGGFDGSFDFTNIGDVYPDTVPYVLMRYFAAVLGLTTVVLCYLTLRSSGVRPLIAFVTASCLLVENSFVTISRYILLDSPLVFFIAAAVYSFKKFEVQVPFTLSWYRSLAACAVSLGLAFSSKWVGLFTIAWAGLMCAIQLWFLIGDLNVSATTIWKHAITRASVLLGVPLVIYLAMFNIHFGILTNDGDGSAFMSSAFRVGLNGSTVPKGTNGPVGYGSIVSLRHLNSKGGYLHSHKHYYPTGSKQQQITLYPHLDSNNDWLIEPYNDTIPDHFVQLKDGDKIRLKHVNTGLRLHSHDEKPPVSERDWQKEVSCYGYEGFAGDANDDWVVEIVQHETKGKAKKELRAIETIFRLRHAMSGHYLFSSPVKLPEWGFEQQEVTSASQGYRPLTHWYIETNKNERLNSTDVVFYPKLTFLQKFIESHKTMWKINSGLTSHHNWQSSPQEWPFLLRGINYWNKNHTQVYFIGNPAIWWTATACLLGFVIHVAISVLKWQTGSLKNLDKTVFNYNYQMFSYFVGWAIHYFPFFIMGRQLFLHHYLPSQYFAILALGQFFELLVGASPRYNKIAYVGLIAFLAMSLIAYRLLSPLIAGSQWNRSTCLTSKLLNSWDFDCNAMLESAEEYEAFFSSLKEEELNPTSVTSVLNESKETLKIVEAEGEAPPPSEESFEEPPPAETHQGRIPFESLQEEPPHGELFDEATTGKAEKVDPEVKVETVEEVKSPGDPNQAVQPEIEVQEILDDEEARETA